MLWEARTTLPTYSRRKITVPKEKITIEGLLENDKLALAQVGYSVFLSSFLIKIKFRLPIPSGTPAPAVTASL